MKQIAAVLISVVLLVLLPACDREQNIPSGPDTTAPLPPVGLTVFDARDGSVLLFWSSNRDGDLAGYRIYRTVEMQPDSFEMIDEASETVFVDERLEYDTTYLYAVTAFDQSGNESEHSSTVSAQPINVSPPRQPRSFRIQAHNREDGVFISLQWDANTEGDLFGYYVYRSSEPDFDAGVQSPVHVVAQIGRSVADLARHSGRRELCPRWRWTRAQEEEERAGQSRPGHHSLAARDADTEGP